MLRFNSSVLFAAAVALPLALGGCAGALVVGGMAAAGGVGYEAAQERGVDGTFTDIKLKTDIQAAWLNEDQTLPMNLTVTAYNGRVLLTGLVPNPEMKRRAREIASRTPGVRALYDEVEVGSPLTAWDSTKDTWISTRVRSELVLDSEVRSGNYTIETADQSVYLLGSARNQTELDHATRIARYVSGVKRVVSYVEIRPGAPIAAQMPSQAPGAMDDRAGAAPRAPIQVQKL